MRKLIGLILVGFAAMVFAYTPPADKLPVVNEAIAKMNLSVIGGGVPAAGSVPTDLLFYANAEGTWSTPTYTLGGSEFYTPGGDNTGTLGSTADVNVTAVKIGTNGFDYPTASDNFQFDVTSDDIISGSQGRIGFWVQVNTYVESAPFFMAKDADQSDYFTIVMYTSLAAMDIRFIFVQPGDAGTIVKLFDTNIDMDPAKWVFLEIAYDFTAGASSYVNVFVDGVGAGAQTGTYGIFTGAYAFNGIYVGNNSANAADSYMDNVFISDDPTRTMYDDNWDDATDVTDIYE